MRGLHALGLSARPAVLEVLSTSLDSPWSWVADEAAHLLMVLGGGEAWDILEGRLDGPTIAQVRALAGLAESDEARGDSPRNLVPAALSLAKSSLEPMLRRAALQLGLADAVFRRDEVAMRELLDWADAEESEDRGLRLAATLVLAVSPAEFLQGVLLERLEDPDPEVAAAAARGLSFREGGHVTERLTAAWEAQGLAGPELSEWRLRPDSSPQLRKDLASALLGRRGLDVTRVFQMRDDPSPAVRMVVYRHAIEREERTDLGPVPEARPLPELADHLFSAGDVVGATALTSQGPIEIALLADLAPGTVANFVQLSESGFYDNVPVHRLLPDILVGTGDPTGTGFGGPGWTIRDEFSDQPFVRGSIGMHRSGRDNAGSQWFITYSRQAQLDGRYTVFGQVTRGWATLDKLRIGDRIKGITIHRRTLVRPGQDEP